MAEEKNRNVVDPDDPLEGGLEAAFGRPDESDEEAPALLRWLEACSDDVSPVNLRDRGDVREAPVRWLSTTETSQSPPALDRYEVAGEIARGGVGAVFKVRDVKLGRDTAMKVLLDRHRGNPALTRRFIEEAQIAGQLQHPGIAPIHDLGVLDGDTPYFTMKLVNGQTLAVLLGGRRDPSEDRHRFLGVFEKVCQTLAYAHARGVIHRDLKPSNVMVGSFGEVQVMDWGLAKVLSAVGGADDEAATDDSIETIRTGSPGLESRVGSVLGTPSYMSPEQARGLVADLDKRSDVFGLGAILCEILTGKPPYTGETSRAIHQQAKTANTNDALERLHTSGADAQVVALAVRCLAVDPSERPRHAGVVAEELSAHLLSVEQRAQAAEVAAVAATVKARGERKARRLTVALAATVVMAILIGGGFYLIQRGREESVARDVDREISKAEFLRDAARRANVRDVAGWDRALQTAEYAVSLASSSYGVDERLARQARSLRESIDGAARAARSAAARAEKNRRMVVRLEEIRGEHADDLLWYRHEPAYAEAFKAYGLDIDKLDPRVAADRMRDSGIAVELATAMDDWARARRRAPGEDSEAWRKLVKLAQVVDPDPWRNKLRKAVVAQNLDELRALADSQELTDASPLTVQLLGATLVDLGDKVLAESVYRSGLILHPGDFWMHLDLAVLLGDAASPRHEDCLRFMWAALALRPRSPYALNGMGVVRSQMGDLEEAIAFYNRAIAIKPDHAHANYNLGDCRWARGEVSEAIAAYNEALRVDSEFVEARYKLGQILYAQSDLLGAVEAFKEAIRLRPGFVDAYFVLGNALWRIGDVDGAVTAYRETIRLSPEHAEAQYNLGKCLYEQRDDDGAIRAIREAIRLRPRYPEAFNLLGLALKRKGDRVGAVRAFREVIRLEPELAESLFTLGELLYAMGEFTDALKFLRRSHELGSRRQNWTQPSAKLVQDCERMVALEKKLGAVSRGESEPANAAERVALAEVCYFKGLYTAAVRFYKVAFEEDPRLAEDLSMEHRYSAACMAVLAARGQAGDSAELDDANRAVWRKQAIEWLQADLLLWAKILESGRSGARAALRRSLANWLSDGDLADLRDKPAITRLSGREREECRILWTEVETLLRRAQQ